jgi:DNA helicase-2/ATP-dependent DNA helicase PcrA
MPTPDPEFEAAILPLLESAGPALAVGSAGCGKTTVALRKAALAIGAGFAMQHSRALFLSFANATIDRVAEHALTQLPNTERRKLELSTYHGFAWSILRSHGYLLGAPRAISILSPAEQNAFRSHVQDPDTDIRAEFRRLFLTLGTVGFDDFASLANEILISNPQLLSAYGAAYPLIFLDEFQDTTDDQWALVQTLGTVSQLIALGDPQQQIYGHLDGASATRLEDFRERYDPAEIDLSAWNWRSPGSSISKFGRDVLSGQFDESYPEVRLVGTGYPPLFTLKTEVLAALRRRREAGGGTIAILTPNNAMSGSVYDFISSAQESPALPALRIDIHSSKDAGFAGLVFVASLLEIERDDDEGCAAICDAMAIYVRTRSDKLSATGLALAQRLEGYASRIRSGQQVTVQVVAAIRSLLSTSLRTARSGNPFADYLATVSAIAGSESSDLKALASAVRMLNFFTRGSVVDTALAESWRQQGNYEGAVASMKAAVIEFQLNNSKRSSRDLIVMNVHRAKGREFDEVIIYEERYQRFLRDGVEDMTQARFAMNVAVTRAKKQVTILTPTRYLTRLFGGNY